jgi:predicted dehydrogenase
MADKVKVGLIGCGNIAPAYIKWSRTFEILDVAACADIDLSAAQQVAGEHGLRACAVDELLADPEIEIVINLTVPKAHAEVSLAIIAAGKHVHSEKPLAITREDGQKILAAAAKAGVRIGCAPDTFLGGGLQTCRKLIDDGWIGQPVAATAFMLSRGPESWHPNPDFFYAIGGGPLFDMGPYYLTALVNLLGPVRRVTGAIRTSFPERIATSAAQYGRRIPVEVATHITGALDFAAGPIGTLIVSFDVWQHSLPRIEIYGSEGTLIVPDPNAFGGPVQVWRPTDREWREIPLTHSAEVGRGIGVADMAYGLRSGRPHRASGALAYHVLDLMHSIEDASRGGHHVELASTCPQPAPLPLGLLAGRLDD